jgi:hypothetical protein
MFPFGVSRFLPVINATNEDIQSVDDIGAVTILDIAVSQNDRLDCDATN